MQYFLQPVSIWKGKETVTLVTFGTVFHSKQQLKVIPFYAIEVPAFFPAEWHPPLLSRFEDKSQRAEQHVKYTLLEHRCFSNE